MCFAPLNRSLRRWRSKSQRWRAISTVCCEAVETRRLLSFTPAVSYPTIGAPTAVVTADFNNDGRLDLATASPGANTVSALLGNGQGGFAAARQFAAGSGPRSLAVSDFNNDGRLDLAAANDTSTGYGGDLSILLGNGDGTFRPPVSAGGWFGEALSLAPADFNADGNMDVAYTFLDITDWDAAYVQVLLGNGLGGFTFRQYVEVASSSPIGVTVADLNADGKADVITASEDNDTVTVLLGNGDGTLSDGLFSNFTTGTITRAVAVGDFTSDGITDLVVAGQTVDLLFGGLTVVLPGLGDGTFASPIPHYTLNASTYTALTTADFNADGKLDVVTTANTVNLMLGNGDGTFFDAGAFATGASPGAVTVGDFNGDGRPDVAVANSGSNTVSVLLNDGEWPDLSAPRLQIGDVTVTEGNTGTRSATFVVTLSAASTETITVAYATVNGTAAIGSDYQAASGTLTFSPGESSRAIVVTVLSDRLAEPNETFLVNLNGPTNSTIADSQGVGTIVDDEPRVSISDVSRAEGKSKQTTLFTFTVTLSAAYDQPVTMSYRTVDGTAISRDKDYVAKSGTLTFAPGETMKTITIEVKGDSKREANEYFYLDLFGLSGNALFTRNRGTGSLLNDD